MTASQNQAISRCNERCISLAATLDAMSPLKVLSRGYAMAQNVQGNVIRKAEQITVGETLQLQFFDGKVLATVTEKEEEVAHE